MPPIRRACPEADTSESVVRTTDPDESMTSYRVPAAVMLVDPGVERVMIPLVDLRPQLHPISCSPFAVLLML